MNIDIQTPVAQIVLDHSECAPVFQRHRIDYCCKGHLPLAQALAERGADPANVVPELERAIAARRGSVGFDPRTLSTPELIKHIVDVHHRYLRDALPFLVPLSTKVARVHGRNHAELAELREVVQALSDSLEPHLDREEQVLFPALIADQPDPIIDAELESMMEDHLEVAELLDRVRNLTANFELPEDACASYTTLFRELEAMEGDILRHVHLENHALMPRFAAKNGGVQ